jgi:hypothetical protein
MGACLHASDLSDEELTVLAPLLQPSHPARRRQTHLSWRIVNTIFYLLRTFARLTTNRRLAKDYKRLAETGEMLLYFAMSRMPSIAEDRRNLILLPCEEGRSGRKPIQAAQRLHEGNYNFVSWGNERSRIHSKRTLLTFLSTAGATITKKLRFDYSLVYERFILLTKTPRFEFSL